MTHRVALFWLSAALTATGLAGLGVGHGLGVFLAAMAVLGLPHGMTFPLALALLADSTPPTGLPRANADMLGASKLTAVAIPPILGSLVPLVGYQGMTLLILVPVGGFAVLLWVQRSRHAAGPNRPV